MEKVRAELAIFFVEKARALHLTSFLLSVLLYTIATSQSACGNLDSYLTNRFLFAVRLYSDNAQMTSKRGENKEVRYEPQASSVTDVLTTF